MKQLTTNQLAYLYFSAFTLGESNKINEQQEKHYKDVIDALLLFNNVATLENIFFDNEGCAIGSHEEVYDLQITILEIDNFEENETYLKFIEDVEELIETNNFSIKTLNFIITKYFK